MSKKRTKKIKSFVEKIIEEDLDILVGKDSVAIQNILFKTVLFLMLVTV